MMFDLGWQHPFVRGHRRREPQRVSRVVGSGHHGPDQVRQGAAQGHGAAFGRQEEGQRHGQDVH